jgi:flagellar protein FlaG
MSIDKIAGSSPATAAPRPSERIEANMRSAAASVEAPSALPRAEQVAPKVEQIAQRLESYIRSVSRSLEFKVDANSGRTIISVLDAETGDLIRQIPNEEVLRFAELAEEQTVVLLNEKV